MDETVKRKNLRPAIWSGAIVLILLFVLVRCGPMTMSAGFSGQVVAADDGRPVEGVVVVAKWDVLGPAHATVDVLAIEETVTDSAGRFTIPGWGPRFNRHFLRGGLAYYAPELIVFKNGYEPLFERNYRAGSFGGVYRGAEGLDERIFPIIRFDGPMAQYLRRADDVDVSISRLLTQSGCRWRRIPRLLVELDEAGQAAIRAGVDGRPLLIRRIPQRDCVDPEIYLEDFAQ